MNEINCLISLALLVVVVFGANALKFRPLSQNQKKWILRRDGNRCQKFRFVNEKWIQCPNTTNLQVHHILARRAIEVWGLGNPHTPKNLITLCKNHHVGDADSVHPDIPIATRDYGRGNKEAFKDLGTERNLQLKRGKPFWSTMFDSQFIRRAEVNTEKYQQKYPDDPFPTTITYEEV